MLTPTHSKLKTENLQQQTQTYSPRDEGGADRMNVRMDTKITIIIT